MEPNACAYVSALGRSGFKVSMIDFLDGDEAGLKSAVLLVEVRTLATQRGEMGVHRLFISLRSIPRAGGTSFGFGELCRIDGNTVEVETSPDDLKIDYYRSSGAGGQKVNKTSSAVRITHIPTGIVLRLPGRAQPASKQGSRHEDAKSKLIEIRRESTSTR